MKMSSRAIRCILLIVPIVWSPGCREKSAPGAGHGEPQALHGPEATSSLTLTPAAIAAAGIQTAVAARYAFHRRITAPGELEFNPRRLIHLTARIPGRVERVLAVGGDRVHAGQILAEVYSG